MCGVGSDRAKILSPIEIGHSFGGVCEHIVWGGTLNAEERMNWCVIPCVQAAAAASLDTAEL